MTLNAHRRRDLKRTRVARVWLNGVDMTSRCFYADGRRGVVRLYRVNAEGHKYIEHAHFQRWAVPSHLRPRVATEERRGHVRWGKLPV
jgi:hypothetical protein